MPLCSVKDHLEVLGLGLRVTKKEIRTAYHRLALKYHPDKNPGSKEAEAKFRDIQESYDILLGLLPSDDDSAVIDVEDEGSATYWNDMMGLLFKELISYMTKTMKDKKRSATQPHVSPTRTYAAAQVAPQKQNTRREPEHVFEVQADIPLDDVYGGRIKKLKVVVLAWPHIVDDKQNLSHENIYISLVSFKGEYIFKGKGDYISPTKRGDLKVILKVLEHANVHIDSILCPYDLYVEHDVCLYEYYVRESLTFQYFNDRLIEAPYSPGTRVEVVKGEGLPFYDEEADEEKRGDLYVHYNLVLPKFCCGGNNDGKENYELPPEVKDCLAKYFVHEL